MAYNPPPPYGTNPAFPPGGPAPPYGYNPGGFAPGGCMPPGAPMPQPGGYMPQPGGYMPQPGGSFPPPVYNPPVPHSQALPLPAMDGLMIVLQGYVPPSADRFHINMMVGGGHESLPVAFHLNPRFEGTNQVVRNAYLGGDWGQEEREGAFPLRPGADFEVIVLFTTTSFRVAFNGAHFCEFRHRTRMEDITHVLVSGDVAIRSLRFQPPAHAPPVMSPPLPPMGGPVVQPPPPVITYNIGVPHEQKIHGGFVEGRRLNVSGKPTRIEGFAINLCYHDSHKKDIAFHFNPRLNEGCVVRNTMSGHTWGKEERQQPNFPFKQGVHFDLVITCYKDKFLVDINGQRYCEYTHRLRNLAFIKTLYIASSLALSHVSVQ